MTLMLTPYELATLILLVDAPGQVQTDCADFNALLLYKLARADVVEAGAAQARATEGGCHLADILRRRR
ncbi:hypothetical protein SAMN05414139_09238 [Burkholderia sp. D7]|nr:hypothetical protein SAMN05414139_09238 [Burkholderia sp. D7]